MQRVQQKFHADEEQDECQALGQVDEALQQISQQKVQLPQSHQREDVGGEHQVGLTGEPVDRRNRVHREQQVGGGQRDDHQEHRGHHPLATLFDVELETVPAVGGVEVGLREAHDRVVGVVAVVGIANQSDRGHHQKGSEQIENPRKLFDGNGSQRDEDAPEHQRQDDPDQQRLLLVDLGHIEAGHDDDEDEEVVDRQAVFGEPPGVELHTELTAVELPHPQAEQNRHPDVDGQRGDTFAFARLMRPTGEHHHVEKQDRKSDPEGDRPLDRGNIHCADLRPSKNARGLFRRR